MDARQVIIAVMQDVQGVGKNDRNAQQGFNFRGIDAVLNHVGPSLRKHGGFIVPNVLSSEETVGQTAKGSVINISRVKVAYSICAAEGEPVTGTVVAEAFDSGDKATAKAMSVALRTFLIQLLALPTDEPDPDSYSYEAVAVRTEWQELLDGATTREELLALLAEARTAKAPKSVLDAITAKGKTISPKTANA
jgi:hypothetical protein